MNWNDGPLVTPELMSKKKLALKHYKPRSKPAENQEKDTSLHHKDENPTFSTSRDDSEQKHAEIDIQKGEVKSDDINNPVVDQKENSSPTEGDRMLYQSSVWESMDGGYFE